MNPFFQGPRVNSQPSMVEEFNKFVSNFRGDPRQKVEELLRTGQMTQDQFNQYSQMANNLSSLFKRR